MFEKEADEYADGKGHEHYNYLFEKNAGLPADFARWCFKDGATFGYNKANEWHYPSKGEYPKVNQECYFIHSNHYGEGNKPIFTKSSIQVHAGIYTYALDEEGNETTDLCFYDDFIEEEMDIKEVYAWKEIVLPNIKEEY